MGDAVFGTLGGVTPLVSQVASKRRLVKEKELTATEILQVDETLSVFGPQRNVGLAISIERGNAQFFPSEIKILDGLIHVGDREFDSENRVYHGFYIFKSK